MIKALDRWLPGYLASIGRRPGRRGTGRPVHILLCIADHYEPLTPGGRQPDEVGRRRVDAWRRGYPELARQFTDADGRHPVQTFFYPSEEYRPQFLEPLAELCRQRLGEVEIHLHHHRDTPASLARNLADFRDLLRREHGLLGTTHGGNVGYAFIHGNWALCNALGSAGTHCGVDQELTVLRETGCYCDMTMPAGPHPAQSRMVNAIYYAADTPGGRRSHDTGQMVLALPPREPFCPLPNRGDLMLIQGPMALNWGARKWGVLPRIEYGDLTGQLPPTATRMQLWLRQHVHVVGRPEWVFVKLHTHGCADRNLPMLLGEPMRAFHAMLAERYNDGREYCLHYVSAREMYNLAKAAECGAHGDPHPWRDFAIQPPPARA